MIILSLCDYSGAWSKPWKDAGYIVEQIDLQHGGDVRLLEYRHGQVYGILMAPPCTMFCQGSAHLWQKRTEAQMLDGISIIDACLRAVVIYKPVFWALENPAGQLQKWLGPPAFKFHPCDFGDEHTKLTYLWGNFKQPNKVQKARQGKAGVIENAPSTGEARQNLRSKTPEGFARAFYEANRMDE